jgi:hypothetical protein
MLDRNLRARALFSKIKKVGMSYFIQRGTTVKGPFSQAKLKALVQEKKLKNSDGISESADGPWEPLGGTAYKRIRHSAHSGTTPTTPIINDWSVKRGLLGKYRIKFVCPQCSTQLNSEESDIGQRDSCIQCGLYFVLSDSVAEHIISDRERRSEEKSTKAAITHARKLERQQERQREQSLKAEQRRQIAPPISRERNLEEELMESSPWEEEPTEKQVVGATTPSRDPIADDWTDGETGVCWYCTQPHCQTLQCPFCRMVS